MVPWRTIISSVSTNTTIVITATGPPNSARAKFTSTRKPTSIAAYGSPCTSELEAADTARNDLCAVRSCSCAAAESGT